jgi:tetratricopeptide (TPR) repeat protein
VVLLWYQPGKKNELFFKMSTSFRPCRFTFVLGIDRLANYSNLLSHGIETASENPKLEIVMAQSPIVQRLVDEWTQCRFRQVEKEIAQIAEGELPVDDYFRLQLLRSQALFELHRVSEAKALLHSLTTIEPKHSNNFLYALARLTYIDQDMTKAKRLFTTLLDRAESAEEYFNASLGLGYILIHENRYHEASKIQRELEELCDSVSLDKALGYHLFNAQIVFSLDDNSDKAWEIYRTVIKIAGSKSWTYWTIKALYGLAVMEKTLGKLESARTLVNLLKRLSDARRNRFPKLSCQSAIHRTSHWRRIADHLRYGAKANQSPRRRLAIPARQSDYFQFPLLPPQAREVCQQSANCTASLARGSLCTETARPADF